MKHIFPNTDNEDLFWLSACNRQVAWYNRHALAITQSEWTDDPIIKNARFTNVYRELDRGTQYAVTEIAERQAANINTGVSIEGRTSMAVFHLLAYRWFNRISTYEAMREHLDEFLFSQGVIDVNLEVALREYSIQGNKLFTGAYIATYCPNLGAPDTIGNSLIVLQTIARDMGYLVETVRTKGLKDIVEHIQSYPGFGNFMAYQAALDLCYRLVYLDGEPLAPKADVNSWSQLGPGAKKGLELLGVKGPITTLVRAAKELAADQENAFSRMGLDFPYPTGRMGLPVKITLANVEHWLCEFQKYYRMLGGGHVKTIYKPGLDSDWRAKYMTTPWWSGAQKGDKIWQR